MDIEEIDLETIELPEWGRTVDSEKVNQLKNSVLENGLLNPITVVNIEGRLLLAAGKHRYYAAQKLGWTKITANVKKISEVAGEICSLEENICRNELSSIEMSQNLNRLRELKKLREPALFPPEDEFQSLVGINPGNSTNPPVGDEKKKDFVTEIAGKTGKSKGTIYNDLNIAKKIPQNVLDMLKGTWIENNKSELKQLFPLAKETQEAVAEKIMLGEANSVKEALRLINNAPANGTVYSKSDKETWATALQKTVYWTAEMKKVFPQLSKTWDKSLAREISTELSGLSDELMLMAETLYSMHKEGENK